MKVVIAGYGIEGKASYEYWRANGHDVVIADERVELDDAPLDAVTILGPDAFGTLEGFDLIIRSPSVNPHKLPYGEKVWSSTNEFFARCPAPIIGVTGTKGKGTTSSLIASILQVAGRTVHLVGNIGKPALAELSKIEASDIVVYELSSFQLWDAQKSPHVAVVLMIEPDHLDVHDSLEDYLSAKMNIVIHQHADDVALYLHSSHYSELTDVASLVEPRGIPVPDEHYINVENGNFYCRDEKICPVDALQISGEHNVINACMAIAAAWEYTQDHRVIEKGLRSFKGLPHRLKFVREVNSVKFYDDSIATTPGSAIAAIAAFNAPKVLLLGGSDKGADYTELVELCKRTNTKVVALGQTGAAIAGLCSQIGVVCVRGGEAMTEIVSQANGLAQPGDIVILSPAAASFDMFKSYADRGDQFIAAVNTL